MPDPIVVSNTLTLPGADLEWAASRASGPGGQNVNKVASKVELRFDLEGTVALDPPVKDRLRALVAAALVVPKKRRPTKPSRRAKARRMDEKRRVGEKKVARRGGGDE
jgi:ribosome-associated protein